MKKIAALLLAAAVGLLLIEIVVRTWFSVYYKTSFFQPGQIIFFYYPELVKAKEKYDPSKRNILVLAGSVMYEDTIPIEMDGEKVASTFCNLSYFLPEQFNAEERQQINVISLANIAHNSLDSWYKYSMMSDHAFELVLFYHGINDTRANNCPADMFDMDYRHIGFYNELFVFMRHPHKEYFLTPYLLDLMFQKILVGIEIRKTIPRDFSRKFMSGEADMWYRHGSSIKSRFSFERNVSRIIELAQKKQEQLLLSTYAWYLPQNYSLEKFRQRELDYAEQIFPAEIYGDPKNVVSGIQVHNEIIRHLHEQHPQVLLLDFENLVPRNGRHFDDVCHLNENGCRLFAKYLSAAFPQPKK